MFVCTRFLALGLGVVILAGCTTTGPDGAPPVDPPAVAAAPLGYAADAAFAPWVETNHGEVRRVATAAGCVALTFDDGPHPTLTPRLLAILAAEDVRATFFLVGQRVQAWPQIARAMRQAGHELGNHSWSHPQLTGLENDAIRREISRTDAAILAAAGVRPAIIRLPYDASSARVRSLMDRPIIFWDVDTQDWLNLRAAQITANAIAHARSGSIVLMHDIHPSTITAIRPMIQGLRARGLRFVTVSELLSGQACDGPTVAASPRHATLQE